MTQRQQRDKEIRILTKMEQIPRDSESVVRRLAEALVAIEDIEDSIDNRIEASMERGMKSWKAMSREDQEAWLSPEVDEFE